MDARCAGRQPEAPREQWGRITHLKPLYRVRFTYPYQASVTFSGPDGTQGQYFFLAEGRMTMRVRGANHPPRRTDGTFAIDFQGVIEVDDDALIMLDYFGSGRPYPPEARRMVSTATHLSGGSTT